jgi:hypothetical protein
MALWPQQKIRDSGSVRPPMGPPHGLWGVDCAPAIFCTHWPTHRAWDQAHICFLPILQLKLARVEAVKKKIDANNTVVVDSINQTPGFHTTSNLNMYQYVYV